MYTQNSIRIRIGKGMEQKHEIKDKRGSRGAARVAKSLRWSV